MAMFPAFINVSGGGSQGGLIEDGTITQFTNGSTLSAGKYYFLVLASMGASGSTSSVTVTCDNATEIQSISRIIPPRNGIGAACGSSLFYATLDGNTSVTFSGGDWREIYAIAVNPN